MVKEVVGILTPEGLMVAQKDEQKKAYVMVAKVAIMPTPQGQVGMALLPSFIEEIPFSPNIIEVKLQKEVVEQYDSFRAAMSGLTLANNQELLNKIKKISNN